MNAIGECVQRLEERSEQARTMTRLSRRIRNLESAFGRDRSGLIPHTPEWMAHWLARARRILAGAEELPPGEKIPFDVMRAYMQSTDE